MAATDRRPLDVNGRTLTVAVETAPSPRRRWAVLRARLVDELTEEPPRGAVTVASETPGLTARVANDGLIGLTGVAAAVIPDITPPTPLNPVNVDAAMTIRAAGFVPQRVRATIATNVTAEAEFEEGFAPADLGDVTLHRQPVVIRGRTVLAVGGTTQPVAATVRIARPGVWRSLPSVARGNPAEQPEIVSLHPPLAFPRPVGAVLRRREMTEPATVPLKRLEQPVPAAATEIRLGDGIGLSPTNVLLVDGDDPERAERIEIAAIAGGATPDGPARITLAVPLAFAHPAGTPVRRLNRLPAGADKAFTQPAIAGDTCVFLADLTGLAAVQVVEVTGGGFPTEFHALRHFADTSLGDGYFRWPPLSRVAQIEIEADRGGGNPILHRTYVPTYGQPENHIDLVF